METVPAYVNIILFAFEGLLPAASTVLSSMKNQEYRCPSVLIYLLSGDEASAYYIHRNKIVAWSVVRTLACVDRGKEGDYRTTRRQFAVGR